jgi:hypothetical protein
MVKGLPSVSTSLLGGSKSSDAREEREVDDGEARGVSAGDMLAEEATLLEVVEVGTRCKAALGGRAVVDILKKRTSWFERSKQDYGCLMCSTGRIGKRETAATRRPG